MDIFLRFSIHRRKAPKKYVITLDMFNLKKTPLYEPNSQVQVGDERNVDNGFQKALKLFQTKIILYTT